MLNRYKRGKIMIKAIKLTAITLTLILFLGTSHLLAEEERPEASVDIGAFSKYVWRGYEFSDSSIVIQPSVTVSYKGFSFNMWSNLDTDVDDDTDDEQKLNETDLTLSYAKNFNAVSVELGYIYYGLDSAQDSEEFYLSVGIETLLSPCVTIYRETAHLPAWYINFGISHSIALPKEISLDLSASAGYLYSDDDSITEHNSNDKYREFHDGLISMSATIPVDKYIAVTPMIAYSFPLSNKADDHISGVNGFTDDSDYLFGGVTISMAF